MKHELQTRQVECLSLVGRGGSHVPDGHSRWTSGVRGVPFPPAAETAHLEAPERRPQAQDQARPYPHRALEGHGSPDLSGILILFWGAPDGIDSPLLYDLRTLFSLTAIISQSLALFSPRPRPTGMKRARSRRRSIVAPFLLLGDLGLEVVGKEEDGDLLDLSESLRFPISAQVWRPHEVEAFICAAGFTARSGFLRRSSLGGAFSETDPHTTGPGAQRRGDSDVEHASAESANGQQGVRSPGHEEHAHRSLSSARRSCMDPTEVSLCNRSTVGNAAKIQEAWAPRRLRLQPKFTSMVSSKARVREAHRVETARRQHRHHMQQLEEEDAGLVGLSEKPQLLRAALALYDGSTQALWRDLR